MAHLSPHLHGLSDWLELLCTIGPHYVVMLSGDCFGSRHDYVTANTQLVPVRYLDPWGGCAMWLLGIDIAKMHSHVAFPHGICDAGKPDCESAFTTQWL